MRRLGFKCIPANVLLSITALLLIFAGVLWDYLPYFVMQMMLPVSGALVLLLTVRWSRSQRQQEAEFANDICETVEALMDGRETKCFQPYEDSEASKVQGKLLQYYDLMQEGQRQSEQDKQTIQELVSDISHQVKTPVANIRMFTGILQEHSLSCEKQAEFLATMAAQVDKLDFLMQSLIKMSRLETGTFAIHMEEGSLYNTIAEAVNSVWAKADQKHIRMEVECDSQISVKHDAKWTAEALGNILDNAIKYTPEGGSVCVRVRPWHFYTRIDIEDTGIGIAKEHYHDVFQRFYRGGEKASSEGVGLGLYLARGIIARQMGYISVKSEAGKGTVFSVFLLN